MKTHNIQLISDFYSDINDVNNTLVAFSDTNSVNNTFLAFSNINSVNKIFVACYYRQLFGGNNYPLPFFNACSSIKC